eukprot:498621-Rhodomonas_salina.3
MHVAVPRLRHAMSVTDISHATTRHTTTQTITCSFKVAIVLWLCYAMSGTDSTYSLRLKTDPTFLSCAFA